MGQTCWARRKTLVVETLQPVCPGICLLSSSNAAVGDFLKIPAWECSLDSKECSLGSNWVIRTSPSEKLVAKK